MRSFQSIVLAAGKGTRMKSEHVKVLHEVAGKPIIGHVMQASLDAGAERVVVILGHQRAEVEAYLEREFPGKYVVALQEEQKGTGHAVQSCSQYLTDGPEFSLIVSGDVPNMDAATLKAFIDASQNFGFAVMTALLDDPAHYGRIVRTDECDMVGIVEYKDASPEQRAINEINAGFYLAQSSFLRVELDKLCAAPPHNAAGEYYLTDLIEIAANDAVVLGWPVPDARKIQGVNTRVDLAAAESYARETINHRLMLDGVTMLSPQTTYVDATVEIGPDAVLHPNVYIYGKTTIASGAVIEPGSVITNSSIGPDAHIKAQSYITNATVGARTAIGPMAHIRPDSRIGSDCKVGNFVEIKKTSLADGAKASHLTYLGDAVVGEKANVGAGTITCNYDGKRKHVTTIGAGAFIGSNSALVAPITIADGAYVGAGSTLTKDVPEGALGVARGRQQNIDGWARRRRSTEE